jgi:VCBS repeat-containing protein
MLKQYKILVNEGKGSENVLVTVPAGAGASGNPTRIKAKPDTRYELQDDLKGKGLGPDQVRGKRVGKNLYLMFEDNGKPDVIIEGYYDPINLQQVPTIVGKAENGSVYEYIPHDPELSSMSTTLKDGYTPAMLSLGGGPIAGGAFELAGLPLVAAAAGGGLGGLGWLAAGLGAAALGGGGGGGGGGTAGPVAPNGGVAPTVLITTDTNNNGVVNKAELNGATTFAVSASFDKTKVAVGDKVVFTDSGSSAVVKTVVLTQAMIDAGVATTEFAKPAEGATLTVSALLQRDALSSASDKDSAMLDTVSNADPTDPTGSTSLAPAVLITTDTNNDGYVNIIELGAATQFNVDVTFKGKVAPGDTILITGSNNESKSITLTADDVKNGKVSALFTKPADGTALTVTAIIKDQNGNDSLAGSDSAALDITAPEKNTLVELDPVTDTGIKNDLITDVDKPTLLIAAEPGAIVKVTLLGKDYTQNAKLNADGKYVVPVTDSLAPGLYTPQVTVTDSHGNVSTFPGASFVVTNVTVANDVGTVQAGGGTTNTYPATITNNILINDADVYYYSLVPPQKNLTVQSISYLGKVISFGVDYSVNYGIINIKADGTYTYRVDGSKAATLRTSESVQEIFTYTAVNLNDGLVSKSTATLNISVYGDANPSSIGLQYNGPKLIAPSSEQNLVSLGGAAAGTPIKSDFLIKISDPDPEQSYLDISLSGTSVQIDGASGNGKFVFSLNSLSTATSHLYNWEYQLASGASTNITIHDLLTVKSIDGISYQTLEAVIADGTTATTNPNQYFFSAGAKGLMASGSKSAGITDTLFLKNDGLLLDLTAATTRVSDMESFNITGTGQTGSSANTIRLDYTTLTQSMGLHNGHKALYIIGDSGDKVELVGGSDWIKDATASTTGTYVYHYKNGLDELIIQNAINNITFV